MKSLLVTAIAFASLAVPVSAQMATPMPMPTPSPMATPSAFPLSKLPMPSCQSGDPVVLVDPTAKVYYAKGSLHGAPPKDSGYMCESAAQSGGNKAAKTASS
jgi:hypothetical protein